jgi:hypothetical protein
MGPNKALNCNYLIYRANKSKSQKTQFQKSNLPKVNAFAQAGYGNPGLNMLDNSFQTFTCSVQRRTGMCLIGINLKEKEALLISEAIVTTEKRNFLTQYQSSIKGNGK